MRRWLAVILAAPILLWTGYWVVAGLLVKQGVEGFFQNQSHGNLSSQVQVAETRLQGFPTAFQIGFSNIEFRNAQLLSWTVPFVEMSAPSYKPQTVSLDISGPQRIQSQFGALQIDADRFNIGLFFKPELSLPLGNALLRLEAAKLTHESGWHLDMKRLLVMLREIAPGLGDPASLEGVLSDYRLELDGQRLDLSALLADLPPDYHEVISAEADAVLSFSQAWDRAVFQQGPPDLRRIVIRQAAVLFEDTRIVLSGQFEVAQDGVVSGRVVADVHGWYDFLSMLRQTGYVDPTIIELLMETLGDQIKPTEPFQIPLRIEDGMVSFGIFSLGLLPALP